MKLPRTGEVSSSMAVLGLVVERPDTIAGVAFRLTQTFPHAHWSPGAAHSNMPSLAREGLLRVAREGPEPTLDVYEATPEGFVELRRWVRLSTSLPPALRDGLQARLEFVEREELATLVETVRRAERGCSEEYAAAHGRWKAFTNRHPLSALDGEEELFKHELKSIQLMDEAMLWATQAKRLGSLCGRLETLLDGSSTPPNQPGPDDG